MSQHPRIGYGLVKHDAIEGGIVPDIHNLIQAVHGLQIVDSRIVELDCADIANIYKPDVDAGMDRASESLRALGVQAMRGTNEVVAISFPGLDADAETLELIKGIRGKSYHTAANRTVRGVFPHPRPANFDILPEVDRVPFMVQNRFHAPDTPGGSQALRSLLNRAE